MDDLISRQALLEEYDRLHVGEPGRARKMIEDAPSAQPEKRTEERTETHVCDLIDRQAAIDKLDPLFESLAIDKIKALPSAQPEIIRCKDCRYYRQEIDMCDEPYSTAHNVVREDDFCSRAERRKQ